MRHLSVVEVGTWGARLVASATLAYVLCLVLGAEMQAGGASPSWPFILADYALAMVGLAGLAAVPAVAARVAPTSEGWVQLTSRLAMLGFAVLRC